MSSPAGEHTGLPGRPPGGVAGSGASSIVPKTFTVVLFALAGLLFWTSHDTAHGTSIRNDDALLRTSDLVRAKSRQNAVLEQQLSGLRDGIDRLSHRTSGRQTDDSHRSGSVPQAAGVTALTGRALTVTLDDAPPDAHPLVPGVPDPVPNDLVVHQQDLQAVVNALWRGGARGIQVMDQRLISTSAVRCVGNTLLLQGRVYSPPYRITAVGDPAALRRALEQDPAIGNYRQYVAAYGLGWRVGAAHRVTLPGYRGGVDLHYAQALD